MATKKKSTKEEIDPKKAVAFVKKYIKWQKEIEAIQSGARPGGETPPPPKWP